MLSAHEVRDHINREVTNNTDNTITYLPVKEQKEWLYKTIYK